MSSIASITCFAIFAVTLAYDIVEDVEKQQFYLVPLHRQRRQATGIQITPENPGARITATHQGTILKNNNNRLDGSITASKTFRPSGPATVEGALNYQHNPSGSGLTVGAQHTQKYGTDLTATGNANLWQKGNSRLDAVGNYKRHYGGPGGTGKADYYGGLQFSHKF